MSFAVQPRDPAGRGCRVDAIDNEQPLCSKYPNEGGAVATFALIPGAGGQRWYRHRVIDLLEAAGQASVAPDRPATDAIVVGQHRVTRGRVRSGAGP